MDKGIYAISHTGISHRHSLRPNEDSCLSFSVGCYDVLAVFDGISSHAGGDEASRICAETISTFLQRDLNRDVVDVKKAMINAVKEAQLVVVTRRREDPRLSRMGCTATIVCIDRQNRNVCIYSIGDSAAFRVRDGKITKLTIDTTLCGEAMDLGIMSRKEALGYPDGFSLRLWMGMPDDIPEDRFTVWKLHPGDEYIVSTDGLHGYLPQKKMLKIIRRAMSGKEAVECLYDTALRGKDLKGRKNKDDCTICYYHFPDGKSVTNVWHEVRNILLIFVLIGVSFFAGIIIGRKMANNVIDFKQSASVNIEAENQNSDSTNVVIQNMEDYGNPNNF